MTQSGAVMVVSGYNIRAVIAFCRWATRHCINYHIVAKSQNDQILLTTYADRVVIVRKSASLCCEEFCSWVAALREEYGYRRVLILPSTEYLNRFLLDHRDTIETQGCVIPLVDGPLYKTLSNKESFVKLCESYGLDTPEEFTCIPGRLPFVAKPRSYAAANGRQLAPHLIHNEGDLEEFCNTEDTTDYFFQQFVYGRSLYLLAYIGRDRGDILFSQENLMQQARGKSVILARASEFHRTPVAQRYVSMLHHLGFFGLVMIEVRLDEAEGRYFMIEANPRLWGPLQFSVDNDVDLFGAMLRDYGFAVPTRPRARLNSSHYFWSGGIARDSQPVSYHNYSADQFVKEFPTLRCQDIFLRPDTLNLFLEGCGVDDGYG